MRTAILTACAFCLMLGRAPLASATAAQDGTMVLTMLDRGMVGGVRIGMTPPQIETLLQRPLWPEGELNRQMDRAVATVTGAGDLGRLGLDYIAGMPIDAADFVFDVPSDLNRRVQSISLGIRCSDMSELARRLGGWASSGANPQYDWGMHSQPVCNLTLLLAQ